MINTATDINNSLVRSIKAKVELYNGSTLINTFSYTDRLISIDIERVGEDSKFFGFGVCQKVNIHLIDKYRELEITTANAFRVLFTHNAEAAYYSNFPLFYVTEVHRDENTNELSITAYDRIEAATEHTAAELGLAAPYTVDDVMSACADILGATGVRAENINDNSVLLEYENGANLEGTETIREVLNALAEATQSIYYLNGADVLVFKRLSLEDTALVIPKADYVELDAGTNRRLTTIAHVTELGDNVSVTTGLVGTVQYVRDNPFWEMRTDIDSILAEAIAAVGDLSIGQFNLDWRGNYSLEIGDRIEIQVKDDNYIASYVLNDKISYSGAFSQATEWSYTESDSDTDTNSVNLGEALKRTIARVDKQNGEITLLANNTKTSIDAVNELKEQVELKLTSEEVQLQIQQ
jgi:hypothetical protein